MSNDDIGKGLQGFVDLHVEGCGTKDEVVVATVLLLGAQ